MKSRPLNVRALNIASLSRDALSVEGGWPLAQLHRLLPSLAALPDGEVRWLAAGSLRPDPGRAPQTWLRLDLAADVVLECQRCLQPLAHRIQEQRNFRFVASEEEAERLDEETEDDVLAMPARLDLIALIEDELILCLPIVPRHVNCPQPLPGAPAAEDSGDEQVPAVDTADSKPHPFAALKHWRRSDDPDG
jgi:uncharacterized protein